MDNRPIDVVDYKLLPPRQPREYQKDILDLTISEIKDIVRTERHKVDSSGNSPLFPALSSVLIEAATGSGKTFTAGTLISNLRAYL